MPRTETEWSDLPPVELLERQSARLAGMRSRLLRRAGIAHRGPVLDLGAGRGVVTAELEQRSRGPVVALDRRVGPLGPIQALRVAGDACALPFADGAFELIFAQLVFLWIGDLDRAVAEVSRVLRPGGVLLAIEPDFGGAIEHPPEIAAAPLWEEGLRRAGAEPRIGRQLVTRLGAAGLSVSVELAPTLPRLDGDDHLDLLAGLVGEARVSRLRAHERAIPPAERILFVPYFFISATAS